MVFAVAGQLAYMLGTTLPISWPDYLLDNVLSHLVMAAAAALCLLRARLVPGARAAWNLLGISVLVWVVGAIAYDGLSHWAPQTSPGPPDIFWVAFYPVVYLALGMRIRERLRRVHAAGWLDGALGATAAGALAAAVLFGPVVAETGGSFATVAINLAYPLADLLLAGFLVLGIAADGWRASRSQLLVAASFGVLLVADTVYLFQASAGTFTENTLLDTGWSGAMVLIGLAAWQADRRSLAAPPRVRGWVALAAPSAFTVLAVGLLIYGNVRPVGPVAVVLATLTLLIGAVRTAWSFRAMQELALRRRQAVTDELTGLPNRRLLNDRLERAIAAREDDAQLTLLLIDLDGFKEVNDSLGHTAGDLLLRRIGPRLREALREHDLLGRLGGDEFGVLLDGADTDEALAVAARVHAALERPIDVEGLALMIDASIGVATCPDHGADAGALMQHADVAMYHAKASRSGCEVYTPERDASSRERLALLGRLRHAIDGGELVLHYQPKADLRAGGVIGVEALVRWEHPERGLLAPGEFLPIAEQTALMRPLTLWVLDTALADCRRWLDDGRTLSVAVNLALANLIDGGFPGEVAAALDRHGVPAALLQLEITENVVMTDPARVLEVLDALRALGVGLSLDDFGTGHSSFSHLRRLGVDEIKIDLSFVSEMVADPDAAAIVVCTVQLARALRLRTVAEGAEDAETWAALRRAGCDLAQGYFLSRPLPAEQFDAWLAARETVAAVQTS
jgi:diguanylate cyclase (GGDEF)-like protein